MGWVASGEFPDFVFEEADSAIERAVEGIFLGLEGGLDGVLAGAEFGKDIPELPCDDLDEFVEEWFGESEGAAVADGAAEDAAEDVMAVVVAGQDAIGDGKAERADVVGDDAEGDIDFFLCGVAGGAWGGQGGCVLMG